MNSSEFNRPEGRAKRHGRRLKLFYFEQAGSRYYLRFTRLALLVITGLIVVPVAILLVLFAWNGQEKPKDLNININAPLSDPHDYNRPIIQLPRPATPQRALTKQPMPPAPTPQLSQAPDAEARAPTTPSPTPSPKPIKTPT
jgi:hypothetical protein